MPSLKVLTQSCFSFLLVPLTVRNYIFYLYLVLAYIPLIPHTANMNLLFIYTISIYVLVNTLGDWYLAVNKKAKITTYIELTFL